MAAPASKLPKGNRPDARELPQTLASPASSAKHTTSRHCDQNSIVPMIAQIPAGVATNGQRPGSVPPAYASNWS